MLEDDESEQQTAADVYEKLTGKEQQWVSLVEDHLRRLPETLETLLASDSRHEIVLREHSPRWDRSDMDWLAPRFDRHHSLSAARAVLSVAQAIARPDDMDAQIRTACGHWADTGLIAGDAVQAQIPMHLADGHPGLQRVFRRLGRIDGLGPGSGCTALMALRLAGRHPSERQGASVVVRVLFAAEEGDSGRRGALRLAILEDGPSGLYPDLTTMAFLHAGPDFATAANIAWETSEWPRQRQNMRCITWSLTDEGIPCRAVDGASLGAAFALGLAELHRRRSSWRRPVGRSIRADHAITAALGDDRTLLPVTGWSTKLEAAARLEKWTVIAPAASRASAEPVAEALGVRVKFAENLDEVISLAVRRPSKRFWTTVAAVITILAVGLAYLVQSSVQEADGRTLAQRRTAAAADLAARAAGLKQTDPRLAGLLALAGYRIDPTSGRALDAMRDVLQTNSGVARNWQASPTQVDAVVVDDARHRAYTSGDDAFVKVWDVATGRSVGRVGGRAALLAFHDPSAVLAAYGESALTLYDATAADTPVPMGSITYPSCVGRSAEPLALDFTADGTTITIVWNDGVLTDFDVLTRASTPCRRLTDAATKDQLGTYDPGRLLLGADLVVTSDGGATPGGEDEAVVLLNNNRVLSIGLRTHRVQVVIPETSVARPAAMVRASARVVTVATEGGILAWDRDEHRVLSYPLGGLAKKPTAMRVYYDDQVLIAGSDGTMLVPVRSKPGDFGAGLVQPHGGAATTAIMGTKHTIAVANVGGRLSILNEAAGPLTPPPAKPSTSVSFQTPGQLLLSDYFGVTSGTKSYGLLAVDLDQRPKFPNANGSDYPQIRDYPADPFYVNQTAVSPEFVAAAGQTGRGGAVVVWKADGTFLRELQLPPPGDASLPGEKRIIAQLGFVPEAHLLVARHIMGEVGFWSTTTWELLGSIRLPVVC
ncbi:hypothetical protein ACFZBU_46625 [Embleya sp. NPDC008237]|uniref:hypothetical protein n=1 Tax=Embleya sp. NPDC008237 TaxID=3363978 RepID=UPI0036EDEA01